MNRALLNLAIEDLRKQLQGIEPLSQEFLFDPLYANLRSYRPLIGTSATWRTLLSFLLHEQMDFTRRIQIFPGKFDLGNQCLVPAKECTYAKLLEDLTPIPVTEKPLKPVRDGIEALTGRRLSEYMKIDPTTTLKVIKTVYSFCQRRQRFTIFSTFAAPERRKSGMEFRSVHLNEKTQELGALIADLREYLGAELEVERLNEIRDTFESLQSEFEKSKSQIADVLRVQQSSKTLTRSEFRDQLARYIRHYEFDLTPAPKLRLDETLYVYITSLECRHFFQQQIKLIGSALLNKTSVVSIAGELHAFSQSAHPVPARLASTFYTYHASDVRALVEAALQTRVSETAFERYAGYVDSLLSRVLIFEHVAPYALGVPDATPCLIIAGYCAIHIEYLNRSSHTPYWHGRPAIGDSLFKSLELPFNDQTVYEEHTQIWRLRLNAIHAAILGKGDQNDQTLQLTADLLGRISELAQHTDIKSINENALKFFDFLREQCVQPD